LCGSMPVQDHHHHHFHRQRQQQQHPQVHTAHLLRGSWGMGGKKGVRPGRDPVPIIARVRPCVLRVCCCVCAVVCVLCLYVCVC
jgi:hypothetical protein